MGNTYALKIKKINENNLLNGIIFNHDRRIVEYVHYITKLNKYYVENFRRGTIISEFTIYDIITKEEHNIVIERVEAGFFFDGLEFSLELIPRLEKVLFVTNVFDDSISAQKYKDLKFSNTLLLGNDIKYFNGFKDIEMEISNKNARFIFYNFDQDKIFKVDFELHREDTKEFRMGCEMEEIEEINLKGILLNRNKLKTITEEIIKCDVIDKLQDANLPDSNELVNSSQVNDNLQDVLPSNNNKNTNETINLDEKEMDAIGKRIIDQEILLSKNPVDILEDIDISYKLKNDKMEIDLPKLDSIVNKNQELIINDTKIQDFTEENVSSVLFNSNMNQEKNKKYQFKEIKKKYMKYLPIYDKIDSNFNFMYINVKKSRKSILELDHQNYEAIPMENNKEKEKDKTINKRVVLIKSFSLINSDDLVIQSGLKISSIAENTVCIKLIN